MISEQTVLRPDWSGPENVHALCTTRQGGVSQPPWNSLNLGVHVGDNPEHVNENRQLLARFTGLECDQFGWLNQVHGNRVVELTPANLAECPDADASFTRAPGVACVILTADCLPVLLTDRKGSVVGAAHGGWRSLCGGVLENLVDAMAVAPSDLRAWMGPAIGPKRFEVGPDVRDAFIARHGDDEAAFSETGARPGHYLADLYELARRRLQRRGVEIISGGSLCTVRDRDWFFSYRRDGQTGRMATLIWME